MFSWGPKTSSLQVVHGSKLSSFLWICLSSIAFSGICKHKRWIFLHCHDHCKQTKFLDRQILEEEKQGAKLQKEYWNLLLSFLSVFIFLEY
jgi:hypothetical protein